MFTFAAFLHHKGDCYCCSLSLAPLLGEIILSTLHDLKNIEIKILLKIV